MGFSDPETASTNSLSRLEKLRAEFERRGISFADLMPEEKLSMGERLSLYCGAKDYWTKSKFLSALVFVFNSQGPPIEGTVASVSTDETGRVAYLPA
jgi:hypothetical protein